MTEIIKYVGQSELSEARRRDLESKEIPHFPSRNLQIVRSIELKSKRISSYAVEDCEAARRADLIGTKRIFYRQEEVAEARSLDLVSKHTSYEMHMRELIDKRMNTDMEAAEDINDELRVLGERDLELVGQL